MGTIYVVTSLITAQASHLTGVGEAQRRWSSCQKPQSYLVSYQFIFFLKKKAQDFRIRERMKKSKRTNHSEYKKLSALKALRMENKPSWSLLLDTIKIVRSSDWFSPEPNVHKSLGPSRLFQRNFRVYHVRDYFFQKKIFLHTWMKG